MPMAMPMPTSGVIESIALIETIEKKLIVWIEGRHDSSAMLFVETFVSCRQKISTRWLSKKPAMPPLQLCIWLAVVFHPATFQQGTLFKQFFAKKKFWNHVFWARVAIKTFSRRRSHRCDENRVFLVQIGAILASIRPFEVFRAVWIFIPDKSVNRRSDHRNQHDNCYKERIHQGERHRDWVYNRGCKAM